MTLGKAQSGSGSLNRPSSSCFFHEGARIRGDLSVVDPSALAFLRGGCDSAAQYFVVRLPPA